MFGLVIVLLMATAGLCWTRCDRALAYGPSGPAIIEVSGWAALYAFVATVALLSV